MHGLLFPSPSLELSLEELLAAAAEASDTAGDAGLLGLAVCLFDGKKEFGFELMLGSVCFSFAGFSALLEGASPFSSTCIGAADWLDELAIVSGILSIAIEFSSNFLTKF